MNKKTHHIPQNDTSTKQAEVVSKNLINDGLLLQNSEILKTAPESKSFKHQQDVLIKGIVHDVNNNLMGIMAACDQLETRHLNQIETESLLATIRTHIKSATGLMQDLSSNRDLEVPVIMDQAELNDFLNSILPSLRLIAGNSSRVELGSVITHPVKVHPLLLHRVLMQLIRNVADLKIDHPLAFISVRRIPDWCEVSVSDNGPGLHDINAEDVFEPGFTTKDASGARGYGLSAVAWAVKAWGGEFGVEEIEGDTGCRFWLRIPLSDKS